MTIFCCPQYGVLRRLFGDEGYDRGFRTAGLTSFDGFTYTAST
jgi:hypothetical protein